ncbi:MAG TPA: tetratricopeptide repeat protein, partial [Syntrophales bacterium]|nr:tetratricopeptide repeat protein [Syntrophales bacterium]
GGWKLSRPIQEADIPTTIQGIITARLDRLDKEAKRILQEASVIGRAFLYEILGKITALKGPIERSLRGLERHDLIRVRSLQPEMEYIFKHALTQEVVYNGLLKKERQNIHQKVGQVMEELFHDRLPEFYETLAYHFRQGRSFMKAVKYHMKAGEKSLSRYALDEAHQYYKLAFDLLTGKQDLTKDEQELLIDVLINWSFVHYYRGDFWGLSDLLEKYRDIAESIQDKVKIAMFSLWLGISTFHLEMYEDSYPKLKRSLEIGEELNNQWVIGHAFIWLTFTCAELGLLDDAALYGKRAIDLSNSYPSDYIFAWSRAVMAHVNTFKGTGTPNLEMGRTLLDYGMKKSNVRSLVLGHICMGNGHQVKGDFASAIESYKKAIEISLDPHLSQWSLIWLGMCYLENGQVQDAEETLKRVRSFEEKYGSKQHGTPARGLLGIILVLKGNLKQGVEEMEEAKRTGLKNNRKYGCAYADFILGKVFSQIAEGRRAVSLSALAKNIGFLIRHVPFAAKRAEEYFQAAIHQASEIGAKGILARAFLDLGHLYMKKGRDSDARKHITDAIRLFEECEADVFLKQAKESLALLG